MKTLASLVVCAAILVIAQSSTFAQNGARRGFTATDLDSPTAGGHSVYRIDLDHPNLTVEMGKTNVSQELEGFFSIDNFSTSGRANLFGVAETPDATSLGEPSVLVDLTQAATSTTGLGQLVGETHIRFGTESGAAWDPITGIAYSVATDDRTIVVDGQQFPATALYEINPSTGEATQLMLQEGIALDGLATGGDGTLYASDDRVDGGTVRNGLYRFNFDLFVWERIGTLGVDTREDTGLANYRGVSGTETNLYLITEGDGAKLGRLWTVNQTTGAATLVGNITFSDGTEVPEDLEGFDIPWQPLVGE